MATYRQIQDDVKEHYGVTVKTCWIADVKASHGLTVRVAPNRLSSSSRTNPCPPRWRAAIEEALRRDGMLS